MALKDKWKDFGKNTGRAFTNFGKAMGKTAKIVFTDEENKVDENGNSELKNAWKNTGKSFGTAGKSLGTAAGGTGKKIIGKEEKEEYQPVDDASEVVDDKDKKKE